VMRIDVRTGDVFTVARSKVEAAARANKLAPGGIAPPVNSNGDSFIEKAALSDNVENRTNVKSTAFDSTFYIHTTGFMTAGGTCTGALVPTFRRQL
jgi:hypothetical protein